MNPPLRDIELLGPSGVGKTTLLKSLEKCLPAAFVSFKNAVKELQQKGCGLPELSRMDTPLFSSLMSGKFESQGNEVPQGLQEKRAFDFFSQNLSLHLTVPLHLADRRVISDDGIFHNFSDAIVKLEDSDALEGVGRLLHFISLTGSFEYILENLRQRHEETPDTLHDWLGRSGGNTEIIQNQVDAYVKRQAEIERRVSSMGCRVLRLNAEDGLEFNLTKCLAFLEDVVHDANPVYLAQEEFYRVARRIGNGHWASQPLRRRWDYHGRALGILRQINVLDAQDVLEIGTVGMQLVKGSDTLDRDAYWDFPGKNPTFLHDARSIPWPPVRRYKVIVALRVFQYLTPNQAEAFQEAKRLCDHLILVVPEGEAYQPKGLEGSRGITFEQFCDFNDGVPPQIFEKTALGDLYYWNFGGDRG
jgi:energy-coupling factor transporter ATP-binding protein EcfA2